MTSIPATRRGRLKLEAVLFVNHALALWWPGATLMTIDAHPGGSGSRQGWDTEDIDLLIDEGRRQLDRQRADLESIRARAQFLFTAALALLVVLAAAISTVREQGSLMISTIWTLGMLCVALGLLAAGGIISGRAEMGVIDAAFLSRAPAPIAAELAGAYAEIAPTGENTVATRLTVLRDAVLAVLLGGAVEAVLWYVAV